MNERNSFIWPPANKEIAQDVFDYIHSGEPLSIYDRSGVVQELEVKLAAYFGAKYCLLTNSGTAALHSIYFALGLDEDSEVIVPDHTFRATVSPLFLIGCKLILCDCEYDSGNIDYQELEKKITDKTRAIVVTHIYGCPARMEKIMLIAKKYGIIVIEDAAQAFGAQYNGKKVGTFGLAAAFSLQENKLLYGGEGGFIITNDREIYERALLLGHAGKRAKSEVRSPERAFADMGYGAKYRIHPLSAVIALSQLKKVNKLISQTKKNMSLLHDVLSETPKLSLPPMTRSVSDRVYYSFPIKIEEERKSKLDQIRKSFKYYAIPQRDIGCRPLHQHPPFDTTKRPFFFKKSLKQTSAEFSTSDAFFARTIHLPPYYLSENRRIIQKIPGLIQKAFERAGY
jgi:dTDP-4-amino-4,6-dideoxygalactose transaminase